MLTMRRETHKFPAETFGAQSQSAPTMEAEATSRQDSSNTSKTNIRPTSTNDIPNWWTRCEISAFTSAANAPQSQVQKLMGHA